MDSTELIDAENWVDLRVGETGTMIARRASISPAVGHTGAGLVTVAFPDWELMTLDCDDLGALRPDVDMTYYHWRVRRTEDGLKALAVWQPGCPPIPLELPGTPSPAL